MNSFNPSNYSSASSELYESSIEMNNEIVEKGHKNIMKVDIVKFEELCKIFKDKTNLKIKKLSGEDKENFDLMVNYVHLLYGTSYYNKLFEKVKKHFKNTNIKPGTVGGYFAGCLNTVEKGEKMSCGVACAGSMPLPKDEEGWSFCDKAVLMAEKSNEGYVFSIVKPAENDEDYDPAYLFVEGDFSGFTEGEKTELRNLGCERVKLVSYDDNMNYHELHSDAKHLDEIEERKVEVKKTVSKHGRSKNEHHENDDNNYNWLIFLIFLILIILFIYVVYRYYKLKY